MKHNDASPAVGVDFGTTNSSIAYRGAGGALEVVRFASGAGATESFRSLLYFEQIKAAGRAHTRSFTGPAAIEEYLSADKNGRLMQSLKSYLSSRNLTGTEVFGRRHTVEELIARMLRDLRHAAERQIGMPVHAAVAGRPVRFVGAASVEDDEFALTRLRSAFELAGFTSVEFEFEPVAAAYHYESLLDRDELILIGDFGGGTSDFSVLHVGPGVRRRGRTAGDLLGNSGVGIAGDAFDAKIVRKLVSPMLGLGSLEQSVSRNMLAVPNWVYTRLEHWHHLSFLRSRAVTEMLKGAKIRASEPEKIAALLHLIDNDLGFMLHRAVQRTKTELSTRDHAHFHFVDGEMEIRAEVTRATFEGWIAEEMEAIERCVDEVLATAGVRPHKIDRVFLTGGSSFVPAVRAIFERRFGQEKVSSGEEFTSIARGLALRAENP